MAVLPYSSYNFNAEPRDFMVDYRGTVYRLEESSSPNKRDRGELYPREIKNPGMKGTIQDGKLVWVPEEEWEMDKY